MKKIFYLFVAIATLFNIIFILQPATASPVNLVVNGDFETPEVTASQKWDIYDSGTADLGWTVEWAGTYSGAPSVAKLELHRGVLMTAYSNSQSAELDTDWGYASNEQASVKIYQDIETCVGGEYTLSYAWSPRPGHSDNEIEVYWGGVLLNTHSGSTSGWTLETHSGLTPAGDATRLEFIETANPDSLGMFLDAVSVEQTKDCIVREAEITSPGEGETVLGPTDFTAYLIDDDYDSVQWAVRKGTCAMGQGTVLGNVDGHNDPYTWIYNSGTYTHNFLATADTCAWEQGDYCFIFNPKEDSGESDIRLTREFIVASCDEDGDGIKDDEDNCPADPNPGQEDADGDGLGDVCDLCPNDPANDEDEDGICGDVDNCPGIFNPKQEDVDGDKIGDACDPDNDNDDIDNNEDMCSGTDADVPEEELGTNRWIWNGSDWTKGAIPGKGKAKGPDFTVSMEQTNGCSCFQILEWLQENYPEEYGEMKGHYKFGCSISVMEEFIELNQ